MEWGIPQKWDCCATSVHTQLSALEPQSSSLPTKAFLHISCAFTRKAGSFMPSPPGTPVFLDAVVASAVWGWIPTLVVQVPLFMHRYGRLSHLVLLSPGGLQLCSIPCWGDPPDTLGPLAWGIGAGPGCHPSHNYHRDVCLVLTQTWLPAWAPFLLG